MVGVPVQASIATVFGGQGANGVLGELAQLYTTYPEVQDYVQRMCAVLKTAADSPEAQLVTCCISII